MFLSSKQQKFWILRSWCFRRRQIWFVPAGLNGFDDRWVANIGLEPVYLRQLELQVLSGLTLTDLSGRFFASVLLNHLMYLLMFYLWFVPSVWLIVFASVYIDIKGTLCRVHQASVGCVKGVCLCSSQHSQGGDWHPGWERPPAAFHHVSLHRRGCRRCQNIHLRLASTGTNTHKEINVYKPMLISWSKYDGFQLKSF